jgi:hypothetical protein
MRVDRQTIFCTPGRLNNGIQRHWHAQACVQLGGVQELFYSFEVHVGYVVLLAFPGMLADLFGAGNTVACIRSDDERRINLAFRDPAAGIAHQGLLQDADAGQYSGGCISADSAGDFPSRIAVSPAAFGHSNVLNAAQGMRATGIVTSAPYRLQHQVDWLLAARKHILPLRERANPHQYRLMQIDIHSG